MYFNLSELMREPSGSTRTYEVDEEFTPRGDAETQRIKGTVGLLRTDKSVWVSADLDSAVPCTCSRCLKEHWQPIHLTIEEEAYSLVDLETGTRATGPKDSEEGFGIDQTHILDLTEAAREYAALSVPMKPMCRNDCKGICLGCGVNLNDFSCRCDKAVRDGRWGPLLKLLPSNEATEDRKN